MMFERFEGVARDLPGRIAVSNEAGGLTYAEILAQARTLRDWLASAGSPLVLLALPGGPHYTLVQLAALGAGAVHAPIPEKSTAREADLVMALVSPDIVVAQSLAASAPILSALREPATLLSLTDGDAGARREPHRVVSLTEVLQRRTAVLARSRFHGLPIAARMIQFTSGSTGAPKGVILSEASIDADLELNRPHLAQFLARDVFCPVPQHHAMGGAVVLEHVFTGSPTHVANGFAPSMDVARLQEHRCEGILASPSYFKMVLRLGVLSPTRLPLLRSFTIGSASIDPQLVASMQRAYPEAVIHCRYGLSESVGAVARLDLHVGMEFAPGLVGHPIRKVDLGPGLTPPSHGEPRQVLVRSPCNAIAQLTARGVLQPLADADGFLPTGDLGHLDEHGRLHLRGRLTAFLKVNGYRVNPFELESVLRAFPGVQEAVVVGPPDPVQGQRIVACLEMQPSERAPSEAELAAFCRRELAAHKIPQRFIVFPRLPCTHSGKPDRVRLLEGATSQEEETRSAR